MAANPEGTLTEWGIAIGHNKSTVSRRMGQLKAGKFVEASVSGKWRLTLRGQREISLQE
jgi:DNA-binding IclR family transcriptional regulator